MAAGYQSQLGFWQPWGVGGVSIQAGYHSRLGFWQPWGVGGVATQTGYQSQLGFWQPWGVGGIPSASFNPAWSINSNVVLQHGKPI